MDLRTTIEELRAEVEKIERAIKGLERLQNSDVGAGAVAKGRGRKSMGQEERSEVSKRMRQYWANRRKQD